MGFDSYNMSSAISQGNMLNSDVGRMNLQTAMNNKALEDQSKRDAKEAKAQAITDTDTGIFSGIKDSIQEGTAMSNFNNALENYQKVVKPSAVGAGGFSEVKTSAQDLEVKAKQMGVNTQRDYTAEGIAKESGDPDMVKLAKGVGSGAEDELSMGGRIARGVGKGVGLAGGIASSGMDIAADIDSIKNGGPIIAGDNLADKIANIGTIGGTALDMIGLIPGFQIAGVLGTGMQAVAGIAGAVGDAEDTADKVEADKKGETPDKPNLDNTVVAQQSLSGGFAGGRTS